MTITIRFCVFTALLVLTAGSQISQSSEASTGRMIRLDGPSIEVGVVETSFSKQFVDRYSVAINRLKGRASGRAADSSLTIQGAVVASGSLPGNMQKALSRSESFRLQIDPSSRIVRIEALSEYGLLQGVNRLAQMLVAGEGKLTAGEVVDWPTHRRRAVHIVLQDVTLPMVRRVIDNASIAGFNTLMLQLADAADVGSDEIPLRANALTTQQLLAAAEYARLSGLEVIPEIKLLSHQEKFFGTAHPELMFNKVTYDPRSEQVYRIVFDYLDRVINLLHPKAIHIGHDELWGFTPQQREKHLNKGETALPSELYLKDIKRIHTYLASKGVETWIWGDMLLTPEEFPGMRPKNLLGNASYAALRKQLPKTIVICDWHYRDTGSFPSTKTFLGEGFGVLGVTWEKQDSIKAFSRYAAGLTPPTDGMISTIWFYLRRRQWDTVETIISTSGKAFWYAD